MDEFFYDGCENYGGLFIFFFFDMNFFSGLLHEIFDCFVKFLFTLSKILLTNIWFIGKIWNGNFVLDLMWNIVCLMLKIIFVL